MFGSLCLIASKLQKKISLAIFKLITDKLLWRRFESFRRPIFSQFATCMPVSLDLELVEFESLIANLMERLAQVSSFLLVQYLLHSAMLTNHVFHLFPYGLSRE